MGAYELEVKQKVLEIINNMLEELNIEAVATSTATKMNFLGIDKVDMIRLDILIDIHFDIYTSILDMQRCETVGDVVKLVEKELKLKDRR